MDRDYCWWCREYLGHTSDCITVWEKPDKVDAASIADLTDRVNYLTDIVIRLVYIVEKK